MHEFQYILIQLLAKKKERKKEIILINNALKSGLCLGGKLSPFSDISQNIISQFSKNFFSLHFFFFF